MSDARYLHLTETLEREIQVLAPNTALPTEQQYAKRFGVSRVTVRRALDLLEGAGLISRRRGRGTIAKPTKINRTLAPVVTVEDDFKSQGLVLETRILEFLPELDPPDYVCEQLKLSKGASVGFLSLLRVVDDRIISFERRYFPSDVARRLDPIELQNRPTLEVIQSLALLSVESFQWELQIVPAFRETAEALGITPGVLAVVTTSTDFLTDGLPVQVNRTAYRIDYVKFRSSGTWTIASRKGSKQERGSKPRRLVADGWILS